MGAARNTTLSPSLGVKVTLIRCTPNGNAVAGGRAGGNMVRNYTAAAAAADLIVF